MEYFSKRVVLVTGAAHGIGNALCHALTAGGATVVATDIDPAGGAQLIKSVASDTLTFHELDVANHQQFESLIDAVRTEHGTLDVVFNNAGIAVTGDARDLSHEQWQRVVDVNQWGVINGSMAALKVMAEQGSGHIVNIASLAGLIPFPGNLPYSATKFAVVGMSMSLRAEAQDLGVKVSVVCPGFIQSNIYNASEMVKLDRAQMMANLKFKMVETDEAASRILAGVAANRAIIVFPAYAKIFWWLYRLAPALIKPLALRLIRDLRKARAE